MEARRRSRADGQQSAKQGTDGSVTGFLYDGKRLLHETDEVGGEVTNSYAAGTSDEYGDLIGGGTEPTHQYDAQANTAALLWTTREFASVRESSKPVVPTLPEPTNPAHRTRLARRRIGPTQLFNESNSAD
ncbi:MAG TPA: hypothetical protein VGI81_12960 [Tepidisphaeraceae bacterium]